MENTDSTRTGTGSLPDNSRTPSNSNSAASSASSTPQPSPAPTADTSPDKHKGFIMGNLCMLVAAIFWGINVSVTKALIPEWMTADGVTAVRLVGGAALFWLVASFMKREKIQRGDWWRLIVGGIVGLFGFIYLFVTSLRYANPIDVSIIMTLPPMFVILIGVCFLGRRPSLMEYLGIIVSFAGAVVVIVSGSSGGAASDALKGDLLAIASCVCYAIYLIIIEGPSKRYRPTTMLKWVFLFAALPGLLLLFGFKDMPIFEAYTAIPWIEILFILLCPTFLAYFLVQPAMRTIGSELVSLYQYLIPVFATISAVVMGIDRLKWLQVLAMVIIIGGMALTNMGKRRRVARNNSGQ